MFEVRYSIVQSQKQDVRVPLPIDEHVRVSSMFWKNDVQVCSMNNLVKVKAFQIPCLMSLRSKPKFKYSSSFDFQKMMFEFVPCSIKWCFAYCIQVLVQHAWWELFWFGVVKFIKILKTWVMFSDLVGFEHEILKFWVVQFCNSL